MSCFGPHEFLLRLDLRKDRGILIPGHNRGLIRHGRHCSSPVPIPEECRPLKQMRVHCLEDSRCQTTPMPRGTDSGLVVEFRPNSTGRLFQHGLCFAFRDFRNLFAGSALNLWASPLLYQGWLVNWLPLGGENLCPSWPFSLLLIKLRAHILVLQPTFIQVVVICVAELPVSEKCV